MVGTRSMVAQGGSQAAAGAFALVEVASDPEKYKARIAELEAKASAAREAERDASARLGELAETVKAEAEARDRAEADLKRRAGVLLEAESAVASLEAARRDCEAAKARMRQELADLRQEVIGAKSGHAAELKALSAEQAKAVAKIKAETEEACRMFLDSVTAMKDAEALARQDLARIVATIQGVMG